MHKMDKIVLEIQEKNRIKQMQELKKPMQELKRNLWCNVYVAYVGSSSSVKNNAKVWADNAVQEFEERFNK